MDAVIELLKSKQSFPLEAKLSTLYLKIRRQHQHLWELRETESSKG